MKENLNGVPELESIIPCKKTRHLMFKDTLQFDQDEDFCSQHFWGNHLLNPNSGGLIVPAYFLGGFFSIKLFFWFFTAGTLNPQPHSWVQLSYRIGGAQFNSAPFSQTWTYKRYFHERQHLKRPHFGPFSPILLLTGLFLLLIGRAPIFIARMPPIKLHPEAPH